MLKVGNYVIRTGLYIDEYERDLVILDIDKLSEHKEIKDRLIELYEGRFKVLMASGNSIHLYTLLDTQDTRNGKFITSEGIVLGDYLGKGKQVIGPGSNIRGKEYKMLGKGIFYISYRELTSKLENIGVRIRHFEGLDNENLFEAPKTGKAYASLLHGSRTRKNTTFNPKNGNWRC